jgi:hypothetical protein
LFQPAKDRSAERAPQSGRRRIRRSVSPSFKRLTWAQHATFDGLRDDKGPREIVRER